MQFDKGELPWRSWPIVPPSTQVKRLHHQNSGSNT
jgi:hypothetical protein